MGDRFDDEKYYDIDGIDKSSLSEKDKKGTSGKDFPKGWTPSQGKEEGDG